MRLGLAADGVVVVEHHRHARHFRGGETAGDQIGVGRGQQDQVCALGDCVLDLALLLLRVALRVLHGDFGVRRLLLHRLDEERRVAALEANGRGVGQQEKDLLRVLRLRSSSDSRRRQKRRQ